jgi:hypothetical protein
LLSMVDMVIGIHKGVKVDAEACDSTRYTRMVVKPLDALSQFGSSRSVHLGCKALAERISPGWISMLPKIPQHGDLFIDNVLHYQDQWHAVDWETFGAVDLPFYDLLTLVLSLMGAPGKDPASSSTRLEQQIPLLIARYGLALDVPDSWISNLLPLTLANWFYLHWLEGRKPIMEKMYKNINDYFEHTDLWHGWFTSSAKECREYESRIA